MEVKEEEEEIKEIMIKQEKNDLYFCYCYSKLKRLRRKKQKEKKKKTIMTQQKEKNDEFLLQDIFSLAFPFSLDRCMCVCACVCVIGASRVRGDFHDAAAGGS